MAESPVAGIKGFLSKEMAGLPVWVWGLVIVAGIGAAYFIPKLFGGQQASDTSGAPGGGAFAGQVPAGCVASDSGGSCPAGYTQMQLADGTVLCCPQSATGGLGGGTGGGGGGGGGITPTPTPTPTPGPGIHCHRTYVVGNFPAGNANLGWAHVAAAGKTSVDTLIKCNPGVVPAGGHGSATPGMVLCVSC